jgi:hypothetical protein
MPNWPKKSIIRLVWERPPPHGVALLEELNWSLADKGHRKLVPPPHSQPLWFGT